MHYNQARALLNSKPVSIKNQNSDPREAAMRKLFTILEDLWVAITFAEAGMYEPAKKDDVQPRCHDAVRIHAA
jgi:hypothetical protein